MEKASSGRNLDANLEMMPILEMLSLIYSFKLYICQDQKIARAYTAQNTKKNALFACLAHRLSAFTSRCGTDTAGRGALEPPPVDGA